MANAKYQFGAVYTALQKRRQVRFEIPSKIPVAHKLLVDMLPENALIEKKTR